VARGRSSVFTSMMISQNEESVPTGASGNSAHFHGWFLLAHLAGTAFWRIAARAGLIAYKRPFFSTLSRLCRTPNRNQIIHDVSSSPGGAVRRRLGGVGPLYPSCASLPGRQPPTYPNRLDGQRSLFDAELTFRAAARGLNEYKSPPRCQLYQRNTGGGLAQTIELINV